MSLETELEEEALALDRAYDEAEALCGRPVEVDRTLDGRYIVVWLNAQRRPPPKGDTPKEALDGFIAHLKSQSAEEASASRN